MQIADIIVFGSVVGEAQQQSILIVEEIKTIISGDLGQNRRTIQVILGFGSIYCFAGSDAGIVVGVADGQALEFEIGLRLLPLEVRTEEVVI